MTVTNNEAIEKSTMRKMGLTLVPFLILCYFIAYVDRVNIGFAALTMNHDLGLTATMFGFGATLFFVAYVACEMPSNLAMERFGAKVWIARIMITWGLVGFCTAFIVGEYSFYVARFLLGAAEAGFFPGVILYITSNFPKKYTARIVAAFMVAIPLSNFFGSPLSALLLQLDGVAGLKGWQWLLMLESIPAMMLGVAAFVVLPNSPRDAKFLTEEQKAWLESTLAREKTEREGSSNRKVHNVFEILKAVVSNKYIWMLSIIYMGSSATSNTLSLWMPQILKSFQLSTWEAGLLNMIPFGFAAVFMIYWGTRADKNGERIWATSIPLLVTAAGFAATLLTNSLPLTLLCLTFVLMGNYAIKGPFWALCSETLPPATLAAGIAAINMIAHVGTGAVSSIIGVLKDQTGSFPMALTPLTAITLTGAVLVFFVQRRPPKMIVRNV